MNDPNIPFIREYGEWAILDAARRTAGSWRQALYRQGLKEIPEKRRYLATNAARRNPNAPRGARFPARPSKRNSTPTPSDNDARDDGRIPIMPPGPSTPASSAGFFDGGMDWNPTPSFSHPARVASPPPQSSFASSSSQPPFNGLGHLPQTHASQMFQVPSFLPWDPSSQPTNPSGTPNNAHYWENSPSGAYTNPVLTRHIARTLKHH